MIRTAEEIFAEWDKKSDAVIDCSDEAMLAFIVDMISSVQRETLEGAARVCVAGMTPAAIWARIQALKP